MPSEERNNRYPSHEAVLQSGIPADVMLTTKPPPRRRSCGTIDCCHRRMRERLSKQRIRRRNNDALDAQKMTLAASSAAERTPKPEGSTGM